MHRMKHLKLGLLIIAFLEIALYFALESISPLLLVLPPVLYLLILLLVKKRYKRKLNRLDLEQIDRLSGLDFEYYLFFLFKKHHIRTRITPYTHDFGADLILRYHGKKIVIQAKRWNDNVGIKAVQETIGAMSYYKAKYGVVITNSFYTKSAVELANASDIVLLNRYDLADMMHLDTAELLDLLLSKKAKKNFFLDSPADICPYCKSNLVKRTGRYGSFYGCSNYPKCTYTRDLS